MKYARDEFEHEGIVYRAYTDGQIGYYRVTPVAKPMLRIGAYRHAMGDGIAEFPMRLERNRTDNTTGRWREAANITGG